MVVTISGEPKSRPPSVYCMSYMWPGKLYAVASGKVPMIYDSDGICGTQNVVVGMWFETDF